MSAPPHIQDAFTAIMGPSSQRQQPPNYKPDCTYQAFVTAISLFGSSKVVESPFLIKAYNTLIQRVEQGSNPNDIKKLNRFNKHYTAELKSLL